jgi:hypothetical protein
MSTSPADPEPDRVESGQSLAGALPLVGEGEFS